MPQLIAPQKQLQLTKLSSEDVTNYLGNLLRKTAPLNYPGKFKLLK